MKKSYRVSVSVAIVIALVAVFSGVYAYSGSQVTDNQPRDVVFEPEGNLPVDQSVKQSVTIEEVEVVEEIATEPEPQEKNPEPTQVAQTKPAQQPVVQQPARNATPEPSRGTSRSDDVYWLARIIHAEAEGEPYIGKVAVGNVVLNRLNSPRFPNTIYGVIFDVQEGYTQFSPVLDGRIYNKPNSESIRAAEAALNGERPVGTALYFLNPRKAENFWIPKNRQFMMSLGGHDFYY